LLLDPRRAASADWKDGFGLVVDGEEEIGGRATTVDALDLQSSERDSILGRKLNLLALLPTGLKNVPKAISMGHFAAIADAPAEEIAKARDDARNGLLIGLCDIVSVASATGYSANHFRVRWQLKTRENLGQRNEFCRSIITRKIEATIMNLEKSIPRSDKWERAMRSAYAGLSRLEENPPENISELRTLEANCAAAYFRSWVGIPIKWRGTSRRPIPDNWHSIGARSSPFHLAGNRNAAHPVNAILNYAYAALESEIRIKAISDGYDPTIGIMHEGRDGSSKFIFDLMEPERPRVDRAVLDFVRGHVFDPADFIIRTDGVCRLNPEMAPMVVAKVSA